MATRKVAFHWSGGKDSTLALMRLVADADVIVDRLLTTVHPARGASTVHGLPVELLEEQADRLGLPMQLVPMPGAALDGYETVMAELAAQLAAEGIEAVAFGDLSCSGVLDAKVAQFAPYGIDVLEPLWGLTSDEVIEAFLGSGIEAVTVVVDASVLGVESVGVPIDRAFIAGLPEGVDPCGEFGEFHSFVFDGPLFASPVPYSLSEPRFIEHEIGTTDGPRTYAYWLATPQPLADSARSVVPPHQPR
jgi:uncharacterized protein (TIGR00290 family)